MARTSNPETMRQRILAAAIEAFGRLGFHRATMDTVAAAAQLSKGTLYLYFRAKEEVLIAGFRHHSDLILDQARARAGKGNLSSVSRIATYLRAALEGIQQVPAGYPLYFEFMSLASHPAYGGQVREMLEALYARFQSTVVAFLAAGQANGEFPKTVARELVAAALGALFDGYCMQRHFRPQPPTIDQAAEMVRLFLAGTASVATPRAARRPVRRRKGRSL
jgi:AcrR family transcriptional regulator